ncbi:ATP-binding cassette domain-containing protein [Paenibacillus larvae]|nr:ATP-binding cassette domain-containing protein [Paenibacillus larvae]MDT2276753.1 ATP-binding cassette domain-containing protein [Paenibacillus larvae]MDT2293356.1 ATP-binding cassette domain-containing protein [Paenibacillus larvae]MDT2305078.1 ATP-binding cassette domain-containing protein [Paenibacillus larvae]
MDKAYKKVEELSGGERQRVAIARALVQGRE